MSRDGRPGVIGTLRAQDGKGVVRMEDRFDTDIDDLWSALTEPARLARWIAEVDGDPRLGGVVRARFTSTWQGRVRVDRCEPPDRLLVTMIDDEDGEDTVVEAQLRRDGEQTLLVIEERGLPLDVLDGHGAGWQAHVEDLAAHLAHRSPAPWRTRWLELTPHYEVLAKDL
ncbi:SRPBCC family protein [Actinocatenispora sera]|uniref:Activator of Hsp90 ATPase homologue 1/2-like C-terminal domain-containing protein n=1 Tax=Actinocatenispora sera TaxID=390989 RepID=A0A810KWB6_9ACTN|nr:SRPBCC family protein [Actinocatenispora sera]BCJ27354.1 hypothetical protein Asera_14620 [Actinocatenispora sera]